MRVITMTVGAGNPSMTSEPWSMDTGKRPPLPQDDFSEAVLTTELEPAADGGQRAIMYPEDCGNGEQSTQWMTADEGLLVELTDVR